MWMTLRHYVCSTRRKSRRCPGNSFLVRSLLARRMTELIPTVWTMDGKPTFHRRANLSWFSKICNHFREIAAWSQKSLTMNTVFLEKRSLKGKFSKNYSERTQEPHRTRSCVQISWNLADQKSAKSCVVYLTKKTSARSPALASARIAPKICPRQPEQYTRSSPNFIQIRSLPAKL